MRTRRFPANAKGKVGSARGQDIGKRRIETAVRIGIAEDIAETVDGVIARKRSLCVARRAFANIAIPKLARNLRLIVSGEARTSGAHAKPLRKIFAGNRAGRTRRLRQPVIGDQAQVVSRLARRQWWRHEWAHAATSRSGRFASRGSRRRSARARLAHSTPG